MSLFYRQNVCYQSKQQGNGAVGKFFFADIRSAKAAIHAIPKASVYCTTSIHKFIPVKLIIAKPDRRFYCLHVHQVHDLCGEKPHLRE